MSAVRLAVSELRRLTIGRMPKLVVLALAAVPLLYGGLYLYANSDPYGRLGGVPAALVVDDAGAMTQEGSLMQAGAKVGDELIVKGLGQGLHLGVVDAFEQPLGRLVRIAGIAEATRVGGLLHLPHNFDAEGRDVIDQHAADVQFFCRFPCDMYIIRIYARLQSVPRIIDKLNRLFDRADAGTGSDEHVDDVGHAEDRGMQERGPAGHPAGIG